MGKQQKSKDKKHDRFLSGLKEDLNDKKEGQKKSVEQECRDTAQRIGNVPEWLIQKAIEVKKHWSKH